MSWCAGTFSAQAHSSRWTPQYRLRIHIELIGTACRTIRAQHGETPTGSVLPVKAEDRTGHVRSGVRHWIAAKLRWQLALDPAEKTSAAEQLDPCPNAPQTVTFVR